MLPNGENNVPVVARVKGWQSAIKRAELAPFVVTCYLGLRQDGVFTEARPLELSKL